MMENQLTQWHTQQEMKAKARDLRNLSEGILKKPEKQSVDKLKSNISPTYDKNSKTNMNRLGEAVPVVYGQTRIFPDLIAPYFERNPSAYNQTVEAFYHFCFGHKDMTISSFIFKQQD